MSNAPQQSQPQSKLGCVLLILFIPGVILVGYGAIRLLYWLTGEPMP